MIIDAATFDSQLKSYATLYEYSNPVRAMTRPLVGRRREMDIILAAFARPELSNVLLLAPAGSGKALANDELIPVPDKRGFVRNGDLVVGDYVYDANGLPTKVLGVYPQGYKKAYRVHFSNGTYVVCNDEHIWHVREGSSESYTDMTLREIICAGIDCNFCIPVVSAVQKHWQDLPLDPYVFGVLVCLYEKKFSDICSHDQFVTQRMADLLGACGDEEVVGKKITEQSIPQSYMRGSVAQRLELLHGLMDICGRNDGCDVRFVTKSYQLTKDVRELAASLGYVTELRSDSLEYSVYFCVSDEKKYDLFWSPQQKNKLNKFIHDDKKSIRHTDELGIVSVEPLPGTVPMTCIYVDNPEHLYLCGKDYIVTHNTAVVQGIAKRDDKRIYLEIDLSRMIANVANPDEMADRLKMLFNEAEQFGREHHEEIVLFMDEFHQMIQLSSAAVEALKPLLADSGTRGIRVIAATTKTEFRKYIASNQPLVERLERVDLAEPDEETVVAILRGMAERYGVDTSVKNQSIYHLIYEYTNRYIPANAQPRKSILVLDAMVGWHKAFGKPLNMKLLADVIYDIEGVNVAFSVDAKSIKAELDKYVIAQQYATSVIEQRLQVCVAGLNNLDRPQASFILTGSSGTGKTELSKQLARLLFDDERKLCRIDCTEFANADSLDRFRHELTMMVWSNPYSIVLLDEIEKACAPVTRVLLQVLDDGRLTDDNGRIVSFVNTYIIMTTNAGSEIYKTIAQYEVSDTGSGEFVERYDKLIRRSLIGTTGDNRFPPELLGRVDAIVPFQPLSEATMEKIAKMKLYELRQRVLKRHNIDLNFDGRVIKYLVADKLTTDSDAGGARAVVAKIDSEIAAAVSREINENPNIVSMLVTVVGDLVSEDKFMLQSDAHIEVASMV